MKKNILFLFFLFFILKSNAQDTVALPNNAKISKIIFSEKDIKIDKDTIEKIVFEPNFKSKYKEKAFDYEVKKKEKNFWERFEEWLSDWFSRFFEFGNKEASMKFVGYLVNFIAILIILFVVYLIIKSFINKEGQWVFGKNSDKKLIRYDDIEKNINAIDFEKLIKETIESGNKRFAIRYYYLWVLKKMSDNEIIEWDLEKTNSDYLNEIKDKNDRDNFAYLSYMYNYIWYGDFEMDDFSFDKAILAFKKTIQSLR